MHRHFSCDETTLAFNLTRSSPFSFKCMRCSVCCMNRTIKIDDDESARLAKRLNISPAEFFAAYTEGEERVLRLKPDGTCIFLAAEGCGVHPDRPLVCRLYPLGWLSAEDGRDIFGKMPPHPDCLGFYDTDGTVDSWLESEGAGPCFEKQRK